MQSQPSTLRSYPRPPVSASNRTPEQYPQSSVSALKPPRPNKFITEQSLPQRHHHHQSNPFLKPQNEQTKKFVPSNQYLHHYQLHNQQKPQQQQQQQQHYKSYQKQNRAQQIPQRQRSPGVNHMDLLKQFKMKRYLADMNLNVCMMKNKSRSPSPVAAIQQKKNESKQIQNDEDQQKECEDSKQRENIFRNRLDQQNITQILETKNNISHKQQLKSPQFNQGIHIDFDKDKEKSGILDVDVDDSVHQDDGAFSEIGGRAGVGAGGRGGAGVDATQFNSKEELKQKMRSPSSQKNLSEPGKALGKSNYLMDIDLSKLSADLAITKKPLSPPVHVNLSPHKRRQRQQNFIIGGDILARVETNCLLKIYFDNWVKMYQERRQLMKQRVLALLEKIQKLEKVRYITKWSNQNREQKRDEQNHSKMLKFMNYRQAVKMKYVLHNMRRFAICQRRWVEQTRQNFNFSRKKDILCSFIQFRNAEKAIKYLNSLKLKRIYEQGLIPLLKERYNNERKCIHFWSYQCQKKGFQSLKAYLGMRSMKKERVKRALKFRQRQVGQCILDIWRGKLAHKLAIKKDKLLTLAQTQNFINLQFTKTVITKRNPMITNLDEEANHFNDGIQKYQQIKLTMLNQ